jgi:DNA-damage-inducible protein J
MASTVLNVRVDEALKRNFDEFCTSVGMNPSVAVNLFMRAVTREHRIPFEISNSKTFSDESATFHERQVKAVHEFISGVNAINNEPLGVEFDQIMSERVNITREIDL